MSHSLTHTRTHTLSHTHKLSVVQVHTAAKKCIRKNDLTQTHTCSHTHTHTDTHSHTPTLTDSHTHTLTHTRPICPPECCPINGHVNKFRRLPDLCLRPFTSDACPGFPLADLLCSLR